MRLFIIRIVIHLGLWAPRTQMKKNVGDKGLARVSNKKKEIEACKNNFLTDQPAMDRRA